MMIGWLIGGMALEAGTGVLSDLFDGNFKSEAVRYYKDLKDLGLSDDDALQKTKRYILDLEMERDMGSW